jgi:hypothetical protein
MIKKTRKERDKVAKTNIGRNLSKQNTDKGRIFEGFSVAQIKKYSTNKSLDITWGISIRNRRSKRYIENLYEFLR